jgi:adenosylhomocysteinase
VLANAGQFDTEISVSDLRSQATSARAVLPLVERFEFGDRALHLLAGGRVVNLAAAEGHPAAVMDVSFALQALAAEALVTGSWTAGVHQVPEAIEREVAALKLAALDVSIDSLTPEQANYLSLTSPPRAR